MPELSPKQQRFVAEYLLDLNATRATIAAGYSENGAAVQGSRLLMNANISAEIARRQAKLAQKYEITAERVLQGLASLAFFDIRKFYREDGSLKPIPELDDETASALCGMEMEEAFEHFGKGQAKPTGLLKKIKMVDRGQNLERLGRHLKLFTDKLEHSADSSLADIIAATRKRAAAKK